MQANLTVERNILEQFAEALGLDLATSLELDNPVGRGSIQFYAFPFDLELYHFKFNLNQPFAINSQNPLNSDWLLLNINLSNAALEKKVNNVQLDFQRFLPSGMLFYPPGTEVESESPPGIPFEIAIVRFRKELLDDFSVAKSYLDQSKAVIYEDLDYQSEKALMEALEKAGENKMLANAKLLEFISAFFEKLNHREQDQIEETIHQQDIKGIFLASAHLRNPVAQEIPSVDKLASIAGMGETKFRSLFKQIFGSAPVQYHLKIKMEYAKDQLLKKTKSPSEVSYELGYSHPSKFTAAYKKHFDALPSEM